MSIGSSWLFSLVLVLSSAAGYAREPVPFKDAYRDGYFFVPWHIGYSDDEYREMFCRLKQSGAREVTVPVYGCQSDSKSSDVGSCEVFSQAEFMRRARLALEAGLKASYLPIV